MSKKKTGKSKSEARQSRKGRLTAESARAQNNSKPENKPDIQAKADYRLGRLRSTPRLVALGLETLEAYSMRKVNEENIRRTSEEAKQERFLESCEQAKKHFSDRKIRDYWLKQLNKAASLPVEYWFDSPAKCLRDKTVVYAITAICMQEYSCFEIIPESFKKTEQYKINKYIAHAFTQFADLSLSEFLSYIEEDLKEQGLLNAEKINGENVVSSIPENQVETKQTAHKQEALVRIETAIANVRVVHSTVKQAAHNKDIYSERAGKKKNSPYLVYKSEVEDKFNPHGHK